VTPPPGEDAPYAVVEERTLDAPLLVVALEGWIDAGLGAANAGATLLAQGPARTLVRFDLERFVDLRARRPTAHIVDGVTSSLAWPELELVCGTDSAGTELLVLTGPEPDFAWRTFTRAVVGLAAGHGVRQVVGLGAFPAPAPHTRPVKLAATAPPPSAALIAEVGVVQGELDVPAGIVSALEVAMGDAGISAVSLWARVPHYVAGMAFPEASAALLEGLARIGGLSIDTAELRGAAITTQDQVDRLIAENPSHQAMVRQLESTIDESEGNAFGTGALPSGDELAAELERFLRDEGDR
jgi:proteasome assembly chaperone (PAC2) family protein